MIAVKNWTHCKNKRINKLCSICKFIVISLFRYKLAEGDSEVITEEMSMQEQIRMKNEYNRIVEQLAVFQLATILGPTKWQWPKSSRPSSVDKLFSQCRKFWGKFGCLSELILARICLKMF